MAEVRKRDGVWYAFWYAWDGTKQKRVRRRRSTGMKVKATAQAQADVWEREETDPDHHKRASATIGTEVAAWLATVAARVTTGQLAAGTLSCYKIKGGHLVRVLEHGGDPKAPRRPRALGELTRPDVDAFTARRTEEGASAHTLHKELSALRSVLKHAKSARRWRGDVDEVVPSDWSPAYQPRERWLPEPELRALLADLSKRTPGRAAAAAWMVCTSAEWGCVVRAQRADVTPARDAVHLRGTKAESRRRTVPVELPWQKQLLTFVLAHADGEGPAMFTTWQNVRRDLHAACARVQIAPCTPNDLRRTACHYLFASGLSERAAVAIMGHSSSDMVRRVYGRLGPDEVRQQMRALQRGEGRGATPPDFGPPST